jgi:hypothetical protein
MLSQSKDRDSFSDKFSISCQKRKKNQLNDKNHNLIGFTETEKETEQRNRFFNNYKKVIKLEEESLLI